MRHALCIGVVLAGLGLAGGAAAGGGECCPPPEPNWLHRLSPVGGWKPDGWGVLGWWNPYCFPCAGTRDDYCRKSLPCACWPPYPPFFTFGPPDAPQACPGCRGGPR
jgi:hypothetical protein